MNTLSGIALVIFAQEQARFKKQQLCVVTITYTCRRVL